MTTRERPTTSGARTGPPAAAPSATPPEPSEASEPPDAFRSRRRHVVDRALDYAALEASGLRAADIARRRRRSKAHVSILLRLGRCLRACTAEELAALRSPRITWKLAQRLVRTSTADDLLRHRLRQALGGFSRLTVDQRRHRRGRRAAVDPLSVPAGTHVWQCDAAWAARDPVGYVEAYRAFLARLHRDVAARLHAASSADAGEPPVLTGQSLRQLTAGLATRPRPTASRTPARRAALERLRELDALLAGAGPPTDGDDDPDPP